jgi:hypothetical protein
MLIAIAILGLWASVGGPVDGQGAFERLKSLAGEWQGTAGDGGAATPATVRYELGSGGTIVRELLFPGTEHEMLSVYHLVGGQLVATHYCAMGNQPHFKLASATADEMVFDFDGGTNFEPARDAHIHSGRLRLVGPDRLAAEWTVFAGGKKTGTNRFSLTRKK